MSDNKDLNAFDDETPTQEEVLNSVSESEETVTEKTDVSVENDDLNRELEEIRDVFQQELDKATAEAETEEEEVEPSEDIDEENDNLCLCCGEKEKMEGSDYCEDCHEAMRRYPFKWVYFLVAALAVYVAVLAVGKIADINRGWVYDYEGQALSEAGWYSEASEKFQYAQNYLYSSKIEPKFVYKRNLENSFKSGGFNMINSFPTSVATLFEEWELNLPYMKDLKKDYMRAQVMAATIQRVNEEVFSQYSEVSTEDLPYEEIKKQITDLEGRMLHIGLDENGNEIEEETTQANSGSMSSSNEVYFKRTENYDTAMLQYFKYYFASTCDRPYEERISFLESVRASEPDMVWLYASDLGIEYAENGDKEKAIEMADLILNESETNIVSYYIRNLVSRKYDKDFDAAVEYCNQGLEYAENYELQRQIALNYLAKGDYKNAQVSAQTAYDMSEDWPAINTLAFCALANGDKDKYKEMYDILASYNEQLGEGEVPISFSDSVLALKRGKATVQQLLEKGGYDVND